MYTGKAIAADYKIWVSTEKIHDVDMPRVIF